MNQFETAIKKREAKKRHTWITAEAHRQSTGHAVAYEVASGRWRCERCPAKGKP